MERNTHMGGLDADTPRLILGNGWSGCRHSPTHPRQWVVWMQTLPDSSSAMGDLDADTHFSSRHSRIEGERWFYHKRRELLQPLLNQDPECAVAAALGRCPFLAKHMMCSMHSTGKGECFFRHRLATLRQHSLRCRSQSSVWQLTEQYQGPLQYPHRPQCWYSKHRMQSAIGMERIIGARVGLTQKLHSSRVLDEVKYWSKK